MYIRSLQLILCIAVIFYWLEESAYARTPLAVNKIIVSDYITQEEVREDGTKLDDNNLYTAWQYTYKDKVAYVDFYFAYPVNIDEVQIFNGYGKSYRTFLRNGRAETITLSGGKFDMSFRLKPDVYDFQRFSIGFEYIQKLRIEINEVKQGTETNDIAISDILFFGNGYTKRAASYAGMVPVIFRDEYMFSERDLKSRRLQFNTQKYDIQKLQLFWFGFLNPENGDYIKLREGYNGVIPAPAAGKYILKRKYRAMGDDAFHPLINKTFLFGSNFIAPVFVTDKVGGIEVNPSNFSGDTKSGSTNDIEDSQWDNVKLHFDYQGNQIDINKAKDTDKEENTEKTEKTEKAIRKPDPVIYDDATGLVTIGKDWRYNTGVKKSRLYNIGSGLYALPIVIKRGKPDKVKCCSVCMFDSKVLLFNENRYVKELSFPAKNNIMPFEIKLDEVPCNSPKENVGGK